MQRLEKWDKELGPAGREEGLCAAIVPHAGWSFSGKTAWMGWRSLQRFDTAVVIGGHLPPGSPLLYGEEEHYQSPAGQISRDDELFTALRNEAERENIPMEPDRGADNSVEVQLPFLSALEEHASVLWLRCGPDAFSQTLGRVLHRIAEASDRRIVCIASTDLTHYGPSYHFTPAEAGEDPYTWVRDVNDAEIISLMREMNSSALLEHANQRRSACSAGAAAAVIEFSLAEQVRTGRFLSYENSYRMAPGESFVGYASLVFSKDDGSFKR